MEERNRVMVRDVCIIQSKDRAKRFVLFAAAKLGEGLTLGSVVATWHEPLVLEERVQGESEGGAEAAFLKS